MLKQLKYLIPFISLLAFCPPALAFNSNALVKFDAPYATFYPGTFDNLVLDFSLITTKPDTLKAVSLKNLGTATYLSQINNLVLWADSGSAGFQGMGVDRKLGNLNFSSVSSSWYLENLSEYIADSQRFFVTAEIFSNVSKSATIQLQIPQLTDNNANASFDVGDFGIFMDSGNNGSGDINLNNANTQAISAITKDIWPPKIVFTNLVDGQIINDDNYNIAGWTRDQGNSSFSAHQLIIDGQAYNITDYDSADYVWNYVWQNISDGQHTVSAQARDSLGNFSQSAAITIMVVKQDILGENSSVTIDKTAIKNDGLDKTTAIVLLKDSVKEPIANRQIEIEADADLIISLPNNESDANGQINFEIRSAVSGSRNITVKADGQVLKTLAINVLPPALLADNINFGDLIKASNLAVYYYGADGKRYAFPNEDIYFSWYSDFKSVKTIADAQLAAIALGGNVTYKPGVKMVKITTDPRVYAVAANGSLRWIKSADIAQSLYGNNWARKVADVSDALFGDYHLADPIADASDFNVAQIIIVADSINKNKGLIAS